MTLKAMLASVLGYRVFPTSILVALTYLALFISLIATDVLPDPPALTERGGLDLKQAYEDLLHITAHPHPYNSHANDRVRSYLLQRLQLVAQDYAHVHVEDDLRSNGSWAGGGFGVYFEGTNILVKIDGVSSSPDSEDGVLFSAHYDSVSTAPGATDDGMGVATLLQLVQYFAENRMPRTAVFNINNGEEDWLNGAHAFLQHPWSNLTEVFLNLEGAGAGGWPILFRASSTSSVKSFRNTKLVPHPHANVLSSDAFHRKFIRSETDYVIYNTPGPRKAMAGLDLAFYKGRSKYHTKYDAVSFMSGGQRSLWSMMETARGVGVNLLSAPFDAETDDSVPVYFDLFKSIILVIPISKILTLNIVALVVPPILLVLFALCEHFLTKAPESESPSEPSEPRPSLLPRRYFQRLSLGTGALDPPEPLDVPQFPRAIYWLEVIWRHIKFWVALGVVIALQSLLMWGYVLFNPFAIHSLPYTVLLAFLSLAYLTLTFVLTFPSSLPFYFPKYLALASVASQPTAQRQKHTIFIHLYVFTWILLVLSTVGITELRPPVGGGYLFTTWNIAVGIACMLAAVESVILTSPGASPSAVAGLGTEQRNQSEEGSNIRPGRSLGSPDERTPLIPRDGAERRGDNGSLLPSLQDLSGEGDENQTGSLATWWWIPQFLVSVPMPIILFAHVTTIVMDGMTQTLSDGLSPRDVYSPTALLGLLLVLPLAPFSYKLRPFRPLTFLVIMVFVLSTVYTWLVFPFTVQDPLKVYFQQRVVLPPISTSASPTWNISSEPFLFTTLVGPEPYLRSSLVPILPSSQKNHKPITCRPDPSKHGLTRCEWESGRSMKPVPGTAGQATTDQNIWKEGEFFKVDIKKTGATTARFHVKGRNTRSCRLYFDNHPIFKYSVPASAGKGLQKGYEVSPLGVTEVRLWSRTWENDFVVDVDWRNETTLKGRIACEWNEYESAMVDNGPLENRPSWEKPHDSRAKIPAFEEVLHFLPHWAVASKITDGLVEVWALFIL